MLIEELQALVPNTRLYPASLQRAGGETYIWAQDAHQHYLLIGFDPALPPFGRDTFGGEVQDFDANTALKWCLPSHSNARKMRRFFTWTAPRVLGEQNTFGGDDPLGLASAAHIRAARECGITDPLVLARTSLDELAQSGRSPEDALDAATWAAFQENHREPWGAEAVVKVEAEARRFAAVGFTFFTLKDSNTLTKDDNQKAIASALGALLPNGYDLAIANGYSCYDAEAYSLNKEMRHYRTVSAWLSALRAIARVQPGLFREICALVQPRYYHWIMALPQTLPPQVWMCDVSSWADEDLPKLMDKPSDAELLQTAFREILSGKDKQGAWLFRPRIYRTLLDHEAEHFECVIEDDRRLLRRFGRRS